MSVSPILGRSDWTPGPAVPRLPPEQVRPLIGCVRPSRSVAVDSYGSTLEIGEGEDPGWTSSLTLVARPSTEMAWEPGDDLGYPVRLDLDRVEVRRLRDELTAWLERTGS